MKRLIISHALYVASVARGGSLGSRFPCADSVLCVILTLFRLTSHDIQIFSEVIYI
jgi:hypothetical protein